MEKQRVVSRTAVGGDSEIQRMRSMLSPGTIKPDGTIIFPKDTVRFSNGEVKEIEYKKKIHFWSREAEDEIDEISFLYTGTWSKKVDIRIFRKTNGEFSYYSDSDDKKGIFDLDRNDLSVLVGTLFNEFKIDRWDDCYTQTSHLKGVFAEDGHPHRYISVCDGWSGRLYIKRKNYEKEIVFGSAGPATPVDFNQMIALFTGIFLRDVSVRKECFGDNPEIANRRYYF